MNTEQYNRVIKALLQYVNSLLKKPKIQNKEYLNIIKEDILTKGYVPFKGQKISFLLSFLTADRNMPTNIGEVLIDIRNYSLDGPYMEQTNLENFFE